MNETVKDLDMKVNNTPGLYYKTWKPGDGVTRYKFYNEPGNDYFGPGDDIYCALGIKDAMSFVRGYRAGYSAKK